MKKIIAPIALAAIFATGCSAPKDPAPVAAPQEYVDVTGSVRLPAEDGIVQYQVVSDPETGEYTRCNPMDRPGVKDLGAGGSAKIISSRGDVIDGEIATGDWDGTYCSMRVSFKSVPAGLDFYSLFLGHRAETKITDITVPFALIMGE